VAVKLPGSVCWLLGAALLCALLLLLRHVKVAARWHRGWMADPSCWPRTLPRGCDSETRADNGALLTLIGAIRGRPPDALDTGLERRSTCATAPAAAAQQPCWQQCERA
jgi:hypothetical protein